MTTGLLPTAGPADLSTLTDPQAVAEAFMEALARPDFDVVDALVDDDIVYVNVGLPALRGRRRVVDALRGLDRPGAGFEVYLHAISADGPIVLTERTDVLTFGRFRAQFWVVGRFDVHDGKITLWRDAFDFVDLLRATVRGLAGIAVPSLRSDPPGPGDAPGR